MKKIMILFSLLLSVFIITKNVYAQTYNLVLDRQDGIYYARRGGDLPYYSSQFIIYRLGNEIAYCIEPSKNITTYNYVDTNGEINLPYSEDVKRKIQLIGFFGREYPNHDNVRYSMAAQALIWNLTSHQEITFYARPYEEGDIIDISREKEEIMYLVNAYQELSIPHTIEGEYNTLISFHDDNLLNYEISDYGGNEVFLENTELKIYSKIIGLSYIELKRKEYDDKSTLIFIGNDKDNSQTLGRLRIPNPIYRINLNIKGIKIRINKMDEDNNPITIAGIKFKIKNIDTNQYICENSECLYLTDQNGVLYTKELDFGTYEIEEVKQIIPGYVVNQEKKRIIIERDGIINYSTEGNYVNVDFINKRVKVVIKLLKKQEKFLVDDGINYEMVNGSNIKFKLYKDNIYIGELVTDDNGYLEYDNLSIGNYFLEEIVPENYISDNNVFSFSISQETGEEEKIEKSFEINNYLRKGNLVIKKVDSETFEGIPNTFFDIYYQGAFLFTKKTDEEGFIKLNNLPIGNYFLQEKSANSKYQLTNEKKYFEIKEQELISLIMENEKIMVDVPETKDNTNDYLQLLSIFLIIGLCFYEKAH